jgi:thymidylate kinase
LACGRRPLDGEHPCCRARTSSDAWGSYGLAGSSVVTTALHGRQPLRERLYFELLGRSCPAPDLVLLLDTPGGVAFARKGEHDVGQLEGIRQGYLELRARLPAIELVDGDRPLETVRTEMVGRIWERYRARWRVRGRVG